MSFGEFKLHGHSNIFSLVETKVVLGQVQQPITYSTESWNDFMIHDVNNPLVEEIYGLQ